jgi:hypothetical protein
MIKPTFKDIPGGTVATWAGITAGEECEHVSYSGAPDRTVQVVGTFGGASVSVDGTLEDEPANWLPLTDPQGNSLSIAVARIEAVTELVRYIKPTLHGGDGTTLLTVHILMRSAMR